MKKLFVTLLAATMLVAGATASFAANGNAKKWDKDNNGIPDVGVVVTGNDSYDYVDGDVTCKFRMNYRGTFDNDPYMDSGWIQNHYQCSDGSAFNYLFVHESDPRYTGNPELSIWGTWEWHILTSSGSGNIANPQHPQYAFGS